MPRRAGPDERFAALAPDLLARTSPAELREACLRALRPVPAPRVDLSHVTSVRASVADAIVELADELPGLGRITFRRLTAGLAERIEVVVRFLALLELYKEGVVELDQAEAFGDLLVSWVGEGGSGDGDDIAPVLVADAYAG